MVEVGETAPDFTLPDEANRDVTLSRELGDRPVVLNWYVFDFTRVCTTQMCALRDHVADFRDVGAKVFGVSTDSPHSHRVFRATHNLPYPLLSDWNGDVSERYGVLYEEFHGFRRVSKRAVFVIDAEGIVRYAWITEDAGVAPDVSAVLAATRRLV